MLRVNQLVGFGVAPATGGVSATAWSTTDKPSGITLSGGNLTATGPANFFVRADTGITSGKIYWEALIGTIGTISRYGWSDSTTSVTSNELGDVASAISYNPGNGQVRQNGAALATLPTTTAGNVICIAYDYGASKVWFRINGGNWNNTTDDPATNTGGYSFTSTGTMRPAAQLSTGGTPSMTARFSASSWGFAAPSGFSAMP